MNQEQYRLVIKNSEIISEEGSFFKALPFKINVGNICYDVTFEKNDRHVVVFRIKVADQIICELGHPDYVPLGNPAEFSMHFDCVDIDLIFYALTYVGISNEASVTEYVNSSDRSAFTFDLVQQLFM